MFRQQAQDNGIGFEFKVGQRKSALAVDDDKAQRTLVRSIIEFNVDEAQSGEECLGFLVHWKPDIFLLNMNMAGINGWQLAGANGRFVKYSVGMRRGPNQGETGIRQFANSPQNNELNQICSI